MRRSPRTPKAADAAPPPTPAAEREAGFQAAVIDLATRLRWKCYHSYDSRRDAPGFPDLTLVREGRLLFIELKTARGRLRPAQSAWLDALTGCFLVETYVLRPADWPEIERILA